MQTLDDIIKQAVEEAGLKPANNGTTPEAVKSASGGDGTVADKLYKLADELNKMGDVPIGGVTEKKADDTLRQLAKTVIYQQTLKKASEDRLGVCIEDGTDIEKLAASVELQAAYIDCFDKVAKEDLNKPLTASQKAYLLTTTSPVLGYRTRLQHYKKRREQKGKSPGITDADIDEMITNRNRSAIRGAEIGAGIGAGAGVGVGYGLSRLGVKSKKLYPLSVLATALYGAYAGAGTGPSVRMVKDILNPPSNKKTV